MLDLSPRPGDLEPIETASRDELESLQLERLRWSIRHAYENVAFYRRAFDTADVHPDDCRGLDDLRRFPFTTKNDLRENYPFGMFAVPRQQVVRVPVSGGMTERQVRLIVDFEPDVIMVTPSYMLAIVDELERQGVDPRSTSLKVGIFGAEPWTEEMRREIEARLDMHAVDIYGLSEVLGPGVASECVETKDGLHVWEDHFYPEIVDPMTGEQLPDGEQGELVFTSLTKEALPVIRYRTRDLTRLLPGSARTMRRMEKVAGRTDDMIILRGVNLFPSQIEELILRVSGLAPHFQLVLSRPSRLDELTVRVEARPDAAGSDDRARATQVLTALVKESIGVSVTVDVLEPDLIERSAGKAQRLLDLRR